MLMKSTVVFLRFSRSDYMLNCLSIYLPVISIEHKTMTIKRNPLVLKHEGVVESCTVAGKKTSIGFKDNIVC